MQNTLRTKRPPPNASLLPILGRKWPTRGADEKLAMRYELSIKEELLPFNDAYVRLRQVRVA